MPPQKGSYSVEMKRTARNALEKIHTSERQRLVDKLLWLVNNFTSVTHEPLMEKRFKGCSNPRGRSAYRVLVQPA